MTGDFVVVGAITVVLNDGAFVVGFGKSDGTVGIGVGITATVFGVPDRGIVGRVVNDRTRINSVELDVETGGGLEVVVSGGDIKDWLGPSANGAYGIALLGLVIAPINKPPNKANGAIRTHHRATSRFSEYVRKG